MRFGTNKRRSVRNYASRREQLRLLLLFVPLALVIIVMARLREPNTAEAVNNFFIPPIKPRPLVADSALAPEPATPHPPAAISEIHPDLLKSIEDNTYFRAAEKDAWFRFIELTQKVTIDQSQAVNVEYIQLVDQPNVYRGKLVTVHGTARQITQEKPAENNLGLTSYYRVVIQPADGANWPIIAYCLELPQGVSPGDKLSLDVNVTGLFFKKLSYKWQDGLGIAPVVLAKSISSGSHRTGAVSESKTSVAPRDSSAESTHEVAVTDSSDDGQESLQKVLTLAGWNTERLASFDEGEWLSEAQRTEALELLRRLRSIDSASLENWSQFMSPYYDFTNAGELRNKLFDLVGSVTKVTKRTIAAADAERLEMPEYFECEFEIDGSLGPVSLIVARVPKDWLQRGQLNAPAKASALFLKRLGEETSGRTLWLAKECAWYPGAGGDHWDSEKFFRDEPDPLLGKSVLGATGVDVGLLDIIESRGRIRAEESTAFYQMLRSAARVEPPTLVRIAREQLPLVIGEWKERLESEASEREKALAREVLQRAGEGRYSVAMLFNEPKPQIGRLFVFEGIARRATRVEVGENPAGGSMDVSHRYAIDHYYELEVFTDDSQNYPLIFCVRELPKDFPIGADIHVPVRVAGFFFKNWLYSTRGGRQSDESADSKSTGPRAQFAPLLIGGAPIVLDKTPSAGHAGRLVLAGLFVLAMAGIGAAAAWFARDDRRFRERIPAANVSLTPGQSLNDLNLPTADVPMSRKVEPPSSSGSSD